ncbi:hypothetical protein [Nocardia carnea]|uniref:hypothetical protein n=1 Tax=Nocardia carnea TaxID=37328 RepID=UPI002456A8C0|nr:hypothetical protein [Nocardia carnea]
MGLARKGTRIIAVDGVRYRWAVAAKDEPEMAIVAEIADGQGQRMATIVGQGAVIAPGLVAHVIRTALGRGWLPHRRGTQVTYWSRS